MLLSSFVFFSSFLIIIFIFFLGGGAAKPDTLDGKTNKNGNLPESDDEFLENAAQFYGHLTGLKKQQQDLKEQLAELSNFITEEKEYFWKSKYR